MRVARGGDASERWGRVELAGEGERWGRVEMRLLGMESITRSLCRRYQTKQLHIV